ncbi:MAG TPA: diaminobutyrate--2-oxoglutarate transaminase [Labilithrix sp.]|nr:diaminobutyrate--2-oxoglutarate transaminase [Labilithrix sp.]
MSVAVSEHWSPELGRPSSGTGIFERYESNVRSYCRSFPVVFQRAKGAELFDESGRAYIDFFAGAGALNYGHNPDFIRERLVAYLREDNVAHALDMFTVAKREFLTRFVDVVLTPRSLDYKVQFCGPTGADAVEAALKLARLATGRHTMAAFTGGWHGMTTGCLQVTSNRETRATAGAPLPFTTFLPYPAGPMARADSLALIEATFEDASSGIDKPAAIILETVQSEGGIYIAPADWLRGLRSICDRHGVLLIVDDVQVGCGRTGSFFSFERAGIVPDIVCLSKSIGGYGLPLSLVLMRRELDVWKRAQHTGTFRGNQLAFIAAAAALQYWEDDRFARSVVQKGEVVRASLAPLRQMDENIELRGIGLIHAVDLARAGGAQLAGEVAARCFEKGLVIERCGRGDTALKILPPLTIDDERLAAGCRILVESIAELSPNGRAQS